MIRFIATLLYCAQSFIGLLLALLTIASANAAVIEVREGDRIQDAVNQAVPGDEIRVFPGLYSETVYVDKDDITLRRAVGGSNSASLLSG